MNKQPKSFHERHMAFFYQIVEPMLAALDRLTECKDLGEEPPVEVRDGLFAACIVVKTNLRAMAQRCRADDRWSQAACLDRILADVVSVERAWRTQDMLEDLPDSIPHGWVGEINPQQ